MICGLVGRPASFFRRRLLGWTGLWRPRTLRIDQILDDLPGLRPGVLAGNTSDGFLGELQTGTIFGPHGAKQIPARGLDVLDQQPARTRAAIADVVAAEPDEQVVQASKICVSWQAAIYFGLPWT